MALCEMSDLRNARAYRFLANHEHFSALCQRQRHPSTLELDGAQVTVGNQGA